MSLVYHLFMKPSLRLHDEFRQVLASYSPSDYAMSLISGLRLVLLVAPTATGRSTVIGELSKRADYQLVISDTTRPIRTKNDQPIEIDGRDYFFKSEEDILAGLKQGGYIEADIIHNQQVSGTSIRELQKVDPNRIAISEIYHVGADKVFSIKPDVTMIFLLPPSFDEWMHRLRSRSEITESEIANRMTSAKHELQAGLSRPYYRFVINKDYQDAAAKIDLILKEDYYTEADHNAGLSLAQSLLASVERA